MLEQFQEICAEGVAVIAVTHDAQVTDHADRTITLVDGKISAEDLRVAATGESSGAARSGGSSESARSTGATGTTDPTDSGRVAGSDGTTDDGTEDDRTDHAG